jgi:hypothetical protein
LTRLQRAGDHNRRAAFDLQINAYRTDAKTILPNACTVLYRFLGVCTLEAAGQHVGYAVIWLISAATVHVARALARSLRMPYRRYRIIVKVCLARTHSNWDLGR